MACWMDRTDIIIIMNHINMKDVADLNGDIILIYMVMRLISMLTRKDFLEDSDFPP